MVDNFKSILEFINSKKYFEISSEIVALANKRLCDDLYDAELAYCQNVLDAAGLTLDEISLLLQQDTDRLGRFCLSMIRAEKALNVGQDFNPDEEPEDEPSNETYVGHSPTFLLIFSVVYILIANGKGDLAQYLKNIRQPRSVKYQKVVEKLFGNL